MRELEGQGGESAAAAVDDSDDELAALVAAELGSSVPGASSSEPAEPEPGITSDLYGVAGVRVLTGN